MQLPDFLYCPDPGEIRITGHRIGLFHVMERYREGMSIKEIHDEYPTLPVDLVQRVIDHYLANKAEVDQYVDDYRAELNRQEAATPQTGPSFAELQRRMAERERARAK
jgi:uncharacterized protein (DUF433 family)